MVLFPSGNVAIQYWRSPKLRITLSLSVLMFCLFALTSTGQMRTQDERLPFYETESLVLRRTTDVPQAVEARAFYGKFDRNGDARAPYPPGQAILAAPFYWMGDLLASRLGGIPDLAETRFVVFATSLASAAASAASTGLLFLIFTALKLSLRDALISALLVGLGTPLFSYSAWFFSEPFAIALLLASAFILFEKDDERQIVRSLLGGILLGCTVLIRPTHVLALVIFATALQYATHRDSRSKLAFAIGASVGVIALLAYNFSIFGNPLDFGYPAVMQGKRLNSFETPLLTGLFGFLLSPGKSIFLFAPVILIALANLPALWRQNRALAWVGGALMTVSLLFFARYTQWEGGYSFGPRYLLPSLILLSIAIAPAMARPGQRKAVWVLAVLGFCFQVVGIATSFYADQRANHYIDDQHTYQFSYSVISQFRSFVDLCRGRLPLAAWDRWFVWLHLNRVSSVTIAAICVVFAVGAIASAWALYRAVQDASKDLELTQAQSSALSSAGNV